MKTKSLFVIAVIMLALLVSACGPATINPGGAASYLSVAGSGQAYLAPDIAYIYIGVHTEKLTAAESVAENTAQTETVIKAITDFGIDAKDIRTTNFSIWPMDKYDPISGTPTGEKTYAVDNTVYVTVRELDKLGDLLDTVVQAGANTVNSVQFDVADKDEALKTARADAVKDAQEKAKELAEAPDCHWARSNPLVSLTAIPIPCSTARAVVEVAAEAASVPIQPGQLTFTVTVNISYEIK